MFGANITQEAQLRELTRLAPNPARPEPRVSIYKAAAVAALGAKIGGQDEAARRLGVAPDSPAGQVLRAVTEVGSISGWGSDLTQSSVADLIGGLTGVSAGAALLARGLTIRATRRESVFAPAIATGVVAAWRAEGAPIPVSRFLLDRVELAPRSLTVLMGLTTETLTRASAEAVVRAAMDEATAAALDAALFSDTAGDDTRPAGLLQGVAGLAGYGGGDALALTQDLNALALALTPVSAGGIVLVMSPARALRLSLMAPQLALPVLPSVAVAEDAIIAVAPAALASLAGGVTFNVGRDAALVMTDDAGELVPDGGPASDPVRSYFQTDAVAFRMILGITWGMRGPGVAWIEGATW